MAKVNLTQIKKKLEQLRKTELAIVPTPLEKLSRFGEAIGLKNLYIKRDDNTGLAMGGNKARKLEYLVSEAIKKKCNLLFTIGGIQSNHCRMTVAAAKKYGMNCHIWLLGTKPENETGNVLLDRLLGATIEYLPSMPDEELEKRVEEIMSRWKSEGKKPFYIPIGGSTGLGCLGYVNMIRELSEQLKGVGKGKTSFPTQTGLVIDTILTTSGSGGTQAGMVLGCELFLPKTRVIGISVSRRKVPFTQKVFGVVKEGEKILGLKNLVPMEKITVYDEYIGVKYGVPTEAGVNAILTLAQTEGILLDPVYTGKAMSGLVDLVKKGVISPKEKVLYVHPGGVPAIFAYGKTFIPSTSKGV